MSVSMPPSLSRRLLLSTVTVGTLVLAACGNSDDPLAPGSDNATSSGSSSGVVVGSADFPESQLLATIYAQALENAGIETSTKLNIGSREVYMPALLDGSIDLLPEYAGATLSYLDSDVEATSPEDVAAALEKALPNGVSMLTPSDAQDSDVLAVTQETADEYSLTTISDLGAHASEMVLGGPPEWKTRHEGVVGLQEVYGLNFKEFKTLDVAGPLTLAALTNGQIQVADLTSTTPAIQKDGLVALEDDKFLFPAQNITPIMSTDKVNDAVTAVLDKVSAALTTEDLIEMNGRLDDQESLDDVASDWISAHDLA